MSVQPRNVFAAAALACVLLLSACGSTNRLERDVASDATTRAERDDGPAATGGSGTSSGSRPGTTDTRAASGASVDTPDGSGSVSTGSAPTSSGRVTSPIEIGIVRTAISNAAQFGVDLGELQTVSEAKVDKALVDAFNEKGGIAGRKIVPIYADTDTASNRWDADFAAACAKFTQDNHVEAVLGYAFDFQPALEDCLAREGIPHLSTTFNVPDAPTMARYPRLMALSNPRVERRSITKIEGAIRDGVLRKTNRFGVLMDECSYTIASWNKTVLPAIKRRGLNLAAAERFKCAGGSSDNGRAIQDIQAAILRFRTANVDTVMIHGVAEGPPLLLFTQEASSQGYHPTYIVSSLANAAVLSGQIPEDQARNFHGYGWLPAQDVPPSKWPAVSSAGKRCIAMARSQGLAPSTATDYSLILNFCDALFLYERALKATSGRSDGASVIGVIQNVGTSFVSAITLEGRTQLTRTVHDAPSRYRHFAWDDPCNCFTYRGVSAPIP